MKLNFKNLIYLTPNNIEFHLTATGTQSSNLSKLTVFPSSLFIVLVILPYVLKVTLWLRKEINTFFKP